MIAKWGVSVATILFTVLFIKFLVRLPTSTETPSEKGAHFLQILIVAVSIVVVAVPEGLPLAVTLSLAYAIVRMLQDHNLVKVLQACETMGNATTICSDKTGTLTENKMTVVSGRLGVSDTFVRVSQSGDGTETIQETSMGTYFQTASPQIKHLMLQSIAVNTTAFESTDEKGNRVFFGSKTEAALLYMAREHLGMDDVATERYNANVTQYIPFSSERKWMGTVAKTEDLDGVSYRLLVKGAVEIVLPRCDRVIRVSNGEDLGAETLSDERRKVIDETNAEYASRALRVMGFAYRDFPQWPPQGVRVANDDKTQAEAEDIFRDMVFLGVLGIADPLRPGVTQAVADCRKAGVTVRMVTGDNVLTAKAIARECGILTPGGIVLQGPRFRELTDRELDIVLPRLQVLARSSPGDKERLVKRLKHLNEIVAVTGDGTNDGPALKAADVGFSMGIAGTEVAKEASSIILMDDNFSSIVRAISWGRCINDAVKKFLQVNFLHELSLIVQFQLTVSVVAVGITFVTAVVSDEESPTISPVQLLWVNLIQDTLGALALATDPPTPQLLDRLPQPKSASMISFDMWKMIFGQSVAQITIILILRFCGGKIFTSWSNDSLATVVFNTFVWLQFFNEINCRRIDRKLNVFAGIHRNPFFMLIMLIIIAGQLLIIFVGGAAFSVKRLDGTQWLVSILLGTLAIPSGAIVRLIPNKAVQFFLPKSLYSERHQVSVVDEERQPSDWNSTLENIREDLISIKRLRNRRRLGNLGLRHKRVPKQIPAEAMQSGAVPQTTLDQPSLSRTHSYKSQLEPPLYSIYSPHTLVPALVASSITLPRTPSDTQPATHDSDKLVATIGGIEVYSDSRQSHQGDSATYTGVTGSGDQSIKGKSTADTHGKPPLRLGKLGETSATLLSPPVYGTFSKKAPEE
jgi:P-type Ca2+ transporter type 2C